MQKVDDFHYERVHDGLRHVMRINEGDWCMVSYEAFRVREDMPLADFNPIDRLCNEIESARDGNEPMPMRDMLIEPEVAISMGGIWAKLGREAKRRNKIEQQ